EPDVELDFEPNSESDVEPGDESGKAPGAEPNSELDIEAGKIEPISEWAPTVYETLVESPEDARPDFEPSELPRIDEDTHEGAHENAHEEMRAIRPDATNNGDSAESPLEAASESPEENGAEKSGPIEELKDAVAKIRSRPRRGEMATRRGGRGPPGGNGAHPTPTATATKPSPGAEERPAAKGG